MINSSIYNGQVIHKRFKPKVHYFKYNVFSLLIDLSELETLDKKVRFFSYNRFNLISFYEKDHGERNGSSLVEWVHSNLKKNNIQTRTIFTGNILRQPVAKKFEWESFGNFSVSDNVMESGILLGCHNRQTKDKMDYMLEKIFEAENCLK